MRVYCVNGKQYLFPQMLASWSGKQNGYDVDETVITFGGLNFCIKKTIGRSAPVWRFFSKRIAGQRICHQMISENEARAWVKEHLPADLCEECLNGWPFKKEVQND